MNINKENNNFVLEKLSKFFHIVKVIEEPNSFIKGRSIVELRYKGETYYSTLTLYGGRTMDPRLPYLHHEIIFPGNMFEEDDLFIIIKKIMDKSQLSNVDMGVGLMMKGVILYSGVEHDCKSIVLTRMENQNLPSLKLEIGSDEIEWIYGNPVDDKTYKNIKTGKTDY
jgi:hypothetical protein